MTKSPESFGLSARARRSSRQPISYLMAQAVTNPDLISLAAGLVDSDQLPVQETSRLAQQVLSHPASARKALQYGTTAGLLGLRKALLAHLEKLEGLGPGGLGASPDQIIVSTGSQQLLFLLSDVLVDPGDIVVTSWPSYFVYTGTLQSLGAQVRCVEMDNEGMMPHSLKALLERIRDEGNLSRVKMVYLVSYYQNPTGITLSAGRREQILQIVREFSIDHRICLLEDAAYRELSYSGKVPPSIKSFDRDNQYVALLQTFSKPFSPGLKTGYALLPKDLVEPVIIQKGNHDFGSNNFAQEILLASLEGGGYGDHLEKIRLAYGRKRDAMLQALETQFASEPAVHWTRPEGGLYVWLTLPEGVDTSMDSLLCKRSIEQGVLYVPGEFCFPPDPNRGKPTNTIRLSFGLAKVDQIHEGIARLARAYRSCGYTGESGEITGQTQLPSSKSADFY